MAECVGLPTPPLSLPPSAIGLLGRPNSGRVDGGNIDACYKPQQRFLRDRSLRRLRCWPFLFGLRTMHFNHVAIADHMDNRIPTLPPPKKACRPCCWFDRLGKKSDSLCVRQTVTHSLTSAPSFRPIARMAEREIKKKIFDAYYLFGSSLTSSSPSPTGPGSFVERGGGRWFFF
jgi:hypothetical protein